ncbi:MAG: multiple sugar transport system permease protein [Actinomycetota bacterium]|jgi:multiple sugar transport system permease protein|nr:multiple sugar transport system permease protein [Actinomycetota bacterium]
MKQTKTRQLPYTVLGIVFLAIMLFPVYWMVNTSLQSGPAAVNATLIPLHPTFVAYQQAISEQLGNMGTSLAVAVGTVIFTLLVATPAAYALAKFRLRWVGLVMLALLISQMIPGIVIANALYTAYNDLGLLNSIPGLILADATTSIPFAILILRAFMESIPPSLVEAARVDGAGHWRAFWSIVVPVSRNSIITAGLFSFLFAWSDFVFAVTLTTSATVRPVTLGIYTYLTANIQSWAPVMATAALASIPAIIFLVFAQRYIAAGALGGAVK